MKKVVDIKIPDECRKCKVRPDCPIQDKGRGTLSCGFRIVFWAESTGLMWKALKMIPGKRNLN
jgi:hypothetical protein